LAAESRKNHSYWTKRKEKRSEYKNPITTHLLVNLTSIEATTNHSSDVPLPALRIKNAQIGRNKNQNAQNAKIKAKKHSETMIQTGRQHAPSKHAFFPTLQTNRGIS
jgi:hypothetical protein